MLALDGGGVRGIVSIAFLERIEELLKERSGRGDDFRLSDHFDLIGGTSTGAIIAAGLATGRTVAEVKDLYEELAPASLPSLLVAHSPSGGPFRRTPALAHPRREARRHQAGGPRDQDAARDHHEACRHGQLMDRLQSAGPALLEGPGRRPAPWESALQARQRGSRLDGGTLLFRTGADRTVR